MRLSRVWSGFLVVAGAWNWVIWPRFAGAIWADPRSFEGSTPTGFLWIHAVLIVTSLIIGTVIGVLGIVGWVADHRRRRTGREGSAAS